MQSWSFVLPTESLFGSPSLWYGERESRGFHRCLNIHSYKSSWDSRATITTIAGVAHLCRYTALCMCTHPCKPRLCLSLYQRDRRAEKTLLGAEFQFCILWYVATKLQEPERWEKVQFLQNGKRFKKSVQWDLFFKFSWFNIRDLGEKVYLRSHVISR